MPVVAERCLAPSFEGPLRSGVGPERGPQSLTGGAALRPHRSPHMRRPLGHAPGGLVQMDGRNRPVFMGALATHLMTPHQGRRLGDLEHEQFDGLLRTDRRPETMGRMTLVLAT